MKGIEDYRTRRNPQRINLRSTRRSAPLALVVLSLAMAACSRPVNIERVMNGDPTEGAELLIIATESETNLDRYFDTLLLRAEERTQPLDDKLLANAFEERFIDDWTEDLPSGELQILLWLAECNKRMRFESPDDRARHRGVLLKALEAQLSATSDPEEIGAILKVAYATTFYAPEVTPRDGTSAILEILKEYVAHPDQEVRWLVRRKVSWIGFVCQERYDEILQFLTENVPEQRLYRDENALSGTKVDPLTGLTGNRRLVAEETFLSLMDAPPERLARIAMKHRDDAFPNGDLVTKTAIRRLAIDGTQVGGSAASDELVNLMRRGLQIDVTLHSVCQRAAAREDAADIEAARQCFDAALHAYETTEKGQWRQDLYGVQEGLLRSIQSVIQTEFGNGSGSELFPYINEELSRAIQRIHASTATRPDISDTGPRYHQVRTGVVGNGTITPESGLLREGTKVEFTATPAPNWAFDYWIGNFPGHVNWLSEKTSATIEGALEVYAHFIERPGLTDLDMVGDLDYFLQAVGESATSATFDRNEVVFDSGERVYVGNGILDAAELYLLETVLKTRHLDWTARSAIAHEPVWEAWRANLARASIDLSGYDPRIVRIVAGYMTLGDFDTVESVRDLVENALSGVTIDRNNYDRSSQVYFLWERDADNDGVWNIEEWQAVSPANSLQDIEAFATAALDGDSHVAVSLVDGSQGADELPIR
ncbi:MAG: hypothetical protein AMXMBFR82_06070 [Candidatus Hydrogenedentota bacterium]